MAATIRGYATGSLYGIPSGTVTINASTLSAVPVAGDQLLAFVNNNNADNGNFPVFGPTTPTGWTIAAAQTGGASGNDFAIAFKRTATGTTADNFVFRFGGDGSGGASNTTVIVVALANAGTPVFTSYASSAGVGNRTVEAPSAGSSGDLLLVSAGAYPWSTINAITYSTAPSGMSLVATLGTPPALAPQSSVLYQQVLGTPSTKTVSTTLDASIMGISVSVPYVSAGLTLTASAKSDGAGLLTANANVTVIAQPVVGSGNVTAGPVVASSSSSVGQTTAIITPVTIISTSSVAGVAGTISNGQSSSVNTATSAGVGLVTTAIRVITSSSVSGVGIAASNVTLVMAATSVGQASATNSNVAQLSTSSSAGIGTTSGTTLPPANGTAVVSGSSNVTTGVTIIASTSVTGSSVVTASAALLATSIIAGASTTTSRLATSSTSTVIATGVVGSNGKVLLTYVTPTILPTTNSSKIARRSIARARDRARNSFESLMVSQIYISRRSASNFNLDSGQLTAENDKSVYDGPARLVTASGPVTYTYGEEVNYFSTSYAYIPIDNNGIPIVVDVNDFLQVIAHDDPAMAGRQFRIVDVESTGVIASTRRLQLVGVQTSPAWVDAAVRHPASGYAADTVPPEWTV